MDKLNIPDINIVNFVINSKIWNIEELFKIKLNRIKKYTSVATGVCQKQLFFAGWKDHYNGQLLM